MMHKIIVAISVLIFMSTSAIAEKQYSSLHDLKNSLTHVALGGNRAGNICKSLRASSYSGYHDRSGNYFTSTRLVVKASNYNTKVHEAFIENVSIQPTQSHVSGPTCFNVSQETSGVMVKFYKGQQSVTSNSVTSTHASDVSISASASFGVASVDVGYSQSVSNSTSVTNSTGNTNSTEFDIPFSWVAKDGDYRVWLAVNEYTLNKEITKNVTYTIDRLDYEVTCNFKKHMTIGKDKIRYPKRGGSIKISDLSSTKTYTVPTKIKFNVKYYDQWPSYELEKGKSCPGSAK
jgi:hypothetical protein